MKYLRVTMPDGSKWDVPARVIAENRARYYAKIDPNTTYEGEFDYTMSNNYELKDWAAGNMNWSDVEDHAKRVAVPPLEPDYQEGWVNGEKEIVERD
jgi:hypothetical protein